MSDPARVKSLSLDDLAIDTRLQMRASTPPDAAEEFAENVDELPPGKVILDEDGNYWLTDGHIRVAAHRLAKRTTMKFFVKKGTFKDAMIEAAGANIGHGAMRTQADKAKAVETLLAEDDFFTASSRAIAEVTHCSHTFVEKVRADFKRPEPTGADSSSPEAEKPEETKRTGKDGKKRVAPAASGPIFCARCKRTGPIAKCPACKDARADAKADKQTKRDSPKQGHELYKARDCHQLCGKLIREVDKLGNAYKVAKKDPKRDALQERVQKFKEEFDKWYEKLAKDKAP